jgi:transposase-like protein
MKKGQKNDVTNEEKFVENSIEEKTKRVFSSDLKAKLVKDIVEKRATVLQISKLYAVTCAAIYKWLDKYSPTYTKTVQIVVQMESEAEKTKSLLERVAELERALGRKELQLMYFEKLIEFTSRDVGYDVKKKAVQKLSNGLELKPNSEKKEDGQ